MSKIIFVWLTQQSLKCREDTGDRYWYWDSNQEKNDGFWLLSGKFNNYAYTKQNIIVAVWRKWNFH